MTGKLSDAPQDGGTYELILAVRAVYHRLAHTADALHRDLRIHASQRAVLEALASHGRQSVPSIARTKHVTRQHIQAIVNSLVEAGLAETVENPAHRRSPLLRMTPEGQGRFDRIRVREGRLLTALSAQLGARKLASATRTLRELGEVLGSLDLATARTSRAGRSKGKGRHARVDRKPEK